MNDDVVGQEGDASPRLDNYLPDEEQKEGLEPEEYFDDEAQEPLQLNEK